MKRQAGGDYWPGKSRGEPKEWGRQDMRDAGLSMILAGCRVVLPSFGEVARQWRQEALEAGLAACLATGDAQAQSLGL